MLPSEILNLHPWDLNVCRLSFTEGTAADVDQAQALGRQGALFAVSLPGMG